MKIDNLNTSNITPPNNHKAENLKEVADLLKNYFNLDPKQMKKIDFPDLGVGHLLNN